MGKLHMYMLYFNDPLIVDRTALPITGSLFLPSTGLFVYSIYNLILNSHRNTYFLFLVISFICNLNRYLSSIHIEMGLTLFHFTIKAHL
uniref:Uncharacterized protein n=1 Tax=Arundo donax TaxID=35708 RepID=A0A0A9TXL8_ARUDO